MQTQREYNSRQLHTPTGVNTQTVERAQKTQHPKSYPMEPWAEDMKDSVNDKVCVVCVCG